MDKSLASFIDHARTKGMDHQTIRMLLLSAGWKEKDVAQALTEQTLEMAVPLPPDSGGAREAFFHLLTFVGFYTTAVSLIILFFSYINRLFPDPAMGEYYSSNADLSGIRWSLAAVIVAFPLFYLLSRFLLKDMRVHPEKSVSGIRRWLTYLTLFVAATAIMGDVITLVFYLLEGELSLRFILKVLAVLVIAGTSFAYYFLSLRLPVAAPETKALQRGFGWFSIALVAVAVVWGIWIVGSPMTERGLKFDDRRTEDLRAIQGEIERITLGKTIGLPVTERKMEQPLPATLQDVKDRAVYEAVDIVDPETGAPYTYKVISASRFSLCAVFNGVRDERYDVYWNHGNGEHCYEYDVLGDPPTGSL